MTIGVQQRSFFIGWDVGGWNCDRNANSRDAIVILDSTLSLVGRPWRGNLRESISSSATTSDWIGALFGKCRTPYPEPRPRVTLAIDTPLGFSDEFVRLITRKGFVDADPVAGRNRYIFRETERRLYERRLRPLSAVKDMIGSQATKGMHVLAKFAPQLEHCGVWTDGQALHVIEAYPAACRDDRLIQEFLADQLPLGHDDLTDARICAFIAFLFATNSESLEAPPADVSENEGWIWVPNSREDAHA